MLCYTLYTLKIQQVDVTENMVLEATERRLSDQLRNAKDMGYTDSEVWAALEWVNKDNNDKPFEPFESISTMVDALSYIQKEKKSSTGSFNSFNSPGLRSSLSRFPSSSAISGYYEKDSDGAATLPWSERTRIKCQNRSKLFSEGPSSIFRTVKDFETHGADREVHRSQSLKNLRRQPSSKSLHRSLDLHQDHSFGHHSAKTQVKSSIQRLIDTFENENRRHFEEFQQINHELRRKLENSFNETENLKDMLRLRDEKIRQQEVIFKNYGEMEKRLENANRRIQDHLKDVQLREADILRQQRDYETLQRRHDAEMRKTEEIKNSLNDEIARLVRENDRSMHMMREIDELKEQIRTKDTQLSQLNVDTSSEVTELTAEVNRLKDEIRELEQRQTLGPTCGVCMDSRREVIFMPCLHFTCCKNCSDAMDHCSICRLRIMGKIEFFQ
ncbi:unnamed protein product [Bursaphelenchus okinawaensis]|uniref:RING-type domain-containing protein n=1 Tax=Bursaphelenchus okinawaensis TaxID=465554 RepID=A0A811LBA5_9BILA|nr:unnamed protein product [Bursaphelenchus okinawaensis]CAG9121178.1 unnamed protein product [Bursaphelenchus okinawaensis]